MVTFLFYTYDVSHCIARDTPLLEHGGADRKRRCLRRCLSAAAAVELEEFQFPRYNQKAPPLARWGLGLWKEDYWAKKILFLAIVSPFFTFFKANFFTCPAPMVETLAAVAAHQVPAVVNSQLGYCVSPSLAERKVAYIASIVWNRHSATTSFR
jgi:hypothetical protein